MSTFLTWLRRIVYSLSILIAFSLIISSLAAYIPASTIWLFQFFALAWFPLFCLNAFFVLLWIIVRLKYAIFPLIALAISFTDVSSYFAFHFRSENHPEAGKRFRLMTYNVRGMGVDDWRHIEELRQGLLSVIKSESPDIICLQEFFYQDTGDNQNLKEFRTILGYKYAYYTETEVLENQHWGVAIFSRYPIINGGRIKYHNKTKNGALFGDIKLGDSVIRVFNVHLESIRLSTKDYYYIDSLGGNKGGNIDTGKHVLRKMKRAYIGRDKQADDIAVAISQSPYPVIVCGDFNDPPSSYVYHTIRGQLQDAFVKKGWGIGHSYNGFLPIFRIDNILPDNHFEVLDYSTMHSDYSDHFPVMVDLVKK